MLEDLDKEDLRDMSINAIGDIKPILKYAKKETLDKHKTTKKGQTLSNQIEGWIKVRNVKSEEVNEAPAIDRERHAADEEERDKEDPGQDEGDGGGPALQPDPAAVDVPHGGGPGEPSLGQDHRRICQICDKTFKNKHSLTNHRRGQHSAGGVHTCPECGKTFGRKSNVKAHQEEVHHGKRFPCQLCNRPFTKWSSLKRHIRKTHN